MYVSTLIFFAILQRNGLELKIEGVDRTNLVRFAAEVSGHPPEIPEMPRRGLPVVVTAGRSGPHPNSSMLPILLTSSFVLLLLLRPRFAACSADGKENLSPSPNAGGDESDRRAPSRVNAPDVVAGL